MDVLKFLQEGNVTKNPDYNPKTKKGRKEPPLLVNYNPGESSTDKGRERLSNALARSSFDLTKYAESNYADYNVYINPHSTEEELNKERARNQTAFEQFGHFVAQTVGSEVVLGTMRGFVDLADSAYNLVANRFRDEDKQDNDFSNPISQSIVDWQKQFRERYAIYRENPNESFNLSDTGWWFDNAVSIASTISLLLPGTGLSKLGKLVGVGKVGSKIGKAVGKLTKTPNISAKVGEHIADLGLTSLGMRTAENYIEAKDVFDTVYNENLNKLNNMDELERAELIKDNPKYKGKTNEEIAKYIAGNSADDTFKNDYWLLAMDMLQLRALKNIWKGLPSMKATEALKKHNLSSLNTLIGRTVESPSAVKKTMLNRIKPYSNTIVAELSEGVEEAFQFHTQTYGIDKGRQALDRNYHVNSFIDNLSNPQMAESAFWGWLGGIAFQGLASGAGKLYNKYVGKAKELNEELRMSEISQRQGRINNFVKRMTLLNKNLKPDDNNKSDNEDDYEVLDNRTAENLKRLEIDSFITDLTIDAADVGNYDLLKEFVSDKGFKDYIDNQKILDEAESKSFGDELVNRMDEIYGEYSKEVKRIIANDVLDSSIAARIAKENTYVKLALREEERLQQEAQNELNEIVNKHSDKINEISSFEKAFELRAIKRNVDEFNDKISEVEDNLKKKKISRLKAKIEKARYEKLKKEYVKESGYENETQLNDAVNSVVSNPIQQLNNIDKELGDAVSRKYYSRNNQIYFNSLIANTHEEINNKANEINNTFEVIRQTALGENKGKLEAILDNNDIDEVDKYLNGEEAKLDDKTKNELDKISKEIHLLDEGNISTVELINNIINNKRKEKATKPKTDANGSKSNVKPKMAANAPTIKDVEEETAKDVTDKEEAATSEETTTTSQETTTTQPSSTGEQEVVVKTPIDDVAKPTEDDEKFLESIGSGNKEQVEADVFINDYFMAAFGTDGEEKKKLIEFVVSTPLEDIVDDIIAKGIEAGYTEKQIRDNLKEIPSSYKSMITAMMDESSPYPFSAVTTKIVQILKYKSKITGKDEEGKIDELIKSLIEDYTKSEKVTKSGNVVYLSIPNFLRFINKNLPIDNIDILDLIYKEIKSLALTNELENVVVVNSKYSLNLNKSDLYYILNDINKEDVESENRIQVVPEDQQTMFFTNAINNLKEGDEVIVQHKTIYRTNGTDNYLEFYVKDASGHLVKIGYVGLAKKTPTNDGFYHKSFVLNYTVSKDSNGNYVSSLDNHIAAIINNIDTYGGTIFKLMNKAINGDTSINVDIQDLLASYNTDSNSKAVIDLLIAIGEKKDATTNNIKNIVNALSNIIYYKYTDNIAEIVQNYSNWIAKSYNNYKLMDDIYSVIQNNKEPNVEIKYVSKGLAIHSDKPNDISTTIVNYNPLDFHLGVMQRDGVIKDANTGTDIIQPKFKRRSLMIIIPNGNNAPTYEEIEPVKFDSANPFGKILRDEIVTIIKDFNLGKITYDEVYDRLSSIIGHGNFLTNLGVIKMNDDNRIIIGRKDDKIPLFTIYKYKTNNELGTGVSINMALEKGKQTTFIENTDEANETIEKAVDLLLEKAVYSMSYDFALQTDKKNNYAKFENGKFIINIGGKTFEYVNYLDFIASNKLGKIYLSKVGMGGNVSTNFRFGESSGRKGQIRINFLGEKTKDTTKETAIDELNKTQKDLPIKTVFESIYGNSVIPDDVKSLFPEKVNVELDNIPKENPFASYNNGVFTVYKRFVDSVNKNPAEAIRALLHERVHHEIASSNLFKRNDLLNELREIRDIFSEIINNIDNYPDVLDYIKTKNYDKNVVVSQLRQFIDPNNPAYIEKYKSLKPEDFDNYMLEEFIAESLTNKDLNDFLNAIKVKDEYENTESLWQKIVNFIRKLFNLGDVDKNSLLAKELDILNRVYSPQTAETSETTEEEIKEESEETESKDEEETDSDEKDSDNYDTYDDEYVDGFEEDDLDTDLGDLYSAVTTNIGTISTPRISNFKQGLSMSERVKFDTLASQGEINFRCK